MTIRELYPIWHDDRRASVKGSSMAMYEQRYKLHLENEPISDMEISTLKNSDIQKYCNELFVKYARSYAKSMMNLLKSIIDYFYISNDEPLRVYKIRYPSANLYDRKENRSYTVMEKALLTKYLGSHMNKTANVGILIGLYTGLRIGEVCGLKWEDIDLARGKLSVRRTITRFTANGRSSVHSQTPKTFSSARTIPINEDLRSILGEYRKSPDVYVVSGRTEPSEPSSLRRSHERVCKRVGVPAPRFHSMRHGFASELILAHVDPATVSRLMGHHNASTTLNIYTHTNEKAQFIAVNMNSGGLLAGV